MPNVQEQERELYDLEKMGRFCVSGVEHKKEKDRR
jgi:hypothetical protein